MHLSNAVLALLLLHPCVLFDNAAPIAPCFLF
jgi:hypothetical protein